MHPILTNVNSDIIFLPQNSGIINTPFAAQNSTLCEKTYPNGCRPGPGAHAQKVAAFIIRRWRRSKALVNTLTAHPLRAPPATSTPRSTAVIVPRVRGFSTNTVGPGARPVSLSSPLYSNSRHRSCSGIFVIPFNYPAKSTRIISRSDINSMLKRV